MDWLFTPLSLDFLEGWEAAIGQWVLYLSLAYLAFELVRYAVLRKLNWSLAGDTVTNFITFAAFMVITYGVFALAYISALSWAGRFAVFDIEITAATVLIAIVMADLIYYWEHRFLHRVNLGWATHTVHHSSPHFNISVAYRFGPFDGIAPLAFHLPMALLGFPVFLILFAEGVVQIYQTFLHTEAVKKLPRPVEAIMNTPSHHRVHHGSNREYLDRNYGGVFIIWDRMFGTFAEEKALVNYGLVRPINSVNPITVFLHGLTRLGAEIAAARSIRDVFGAVFAPPDWEPRRRREADPVPARNPARDNA